MVMKTALITLVSALLIAIMALSSDTRNSGSNWAGSPTARGGSAMSVTGASGSFSGGGQRGNWGQGGSRSMSITGASGSFSGGGGRGGWGGDHDGHDDHDGWEGGDD